MIKLSETKITLHFLQRYFYRFDDERLEILFARIERLKPATKPQFNRIKKCSDRTRRSCFFVDRDLVVVVKNNTLLTCWRLP